MVCALAQNRMYTEAAACKKSRALTSSGGDSGSYLPVLSFTSTLHSLPFLGALGFFPHRMQAVHQIHLTIPCNFNILEFTQTQQCLLHE